MKRLRSRSLRTWIDLIRYLALLLMALWLSLAIPGCSGFQAKNPTASVPPEAATSQRFDGITIQVLTHDGAQYTATKQHIAGFEALTGAKVNLQAVPFKDLYDTLQKQWSGNAPKTDLAIILPQWQIDFITAGYLDDLSNRVKADVALQWEDITPLFRKFSTVYQGRNYSVPLDGDFHMVYYRTDLFKQAGVTPPATWDDYLAIAKQFHNKDLNGDGETDYGSCIEKRPKEYSAAILGSFIAPFLQSQGTAQGVFFDPETMKPLVNNPGFAKALEIYQKTMAYGVPQDENLSQAEARKLFLSGRCAMTLDWGDVGTQAIDPAISKVINKVGTSITPGTTEVFDRKTNQLVACNKFTCPYAIEGVNHAPYAAYGGWVGVVATKSTPTRKDAAYAFLSYMGQPSQSNVDVTLGATGYNPYRVSQFNNVAPWIKVGMTSDTANSYLGAIGVSLNSPNMVLDLAIPHNQQYLVEILDAVRADFLLGKLTTPEAMQRLEQEWEALSDRIGQAAQQKAYRSSLGLTP